MKSSPSIKTLILCAGSGTRSGLPYNKIFYALGQKTVLEQTLDAFLASEANDLTLVIAEADQPRIRELLGSAYPVHICFGGATRTESVRKGLESLDGGDIVLIHDCARPYVSGRLIGESIRSAIRFGSGIPALPAIDTMKESDGTRILKTLPRDRLVHIQTPQAFRLADIRKAYAEIAGDFFDDSDVYARAGFVPYTIQGEARNQKITFPGDLYPLSPSSRIGTGFDVHALTENRPLILGGNRIPHPKGLAGHSDADVLTHAVMDALLSALGLPDIGQRFPDKDPRFFNADSMLLLKDVAETLAASGYVLGYLSCVLIAQKPLLAPFLPAIRNTLAESLHIPVNKLHISATTTEFLGVIGQEKGIAASAVCLLHTFMC